MKVLQIITGLGIGGAEQQLRLLVGRLDAETHVVTLTAPGAVADGLRADGIPVTHLGMRGNRDLAALPRLVRIIRDGGYDVVHTHLYRACLYGRIAARLAGVRAVVATEHSLGDDQIEGRPLSAGTRALYLAGERLGRRTVAVSASVARRLEDWGVPGDRITTIPNGIDAARFAYDPAARFAARQRLGIPAEAFVVGGVGRLAPGKRFDTVIRAVAAVPDARLVLVGEGDERARLLDAARRSGVADRVLLTGACVDPAPADAPPGSDLPALLAAMDVLVSNSPDEAFGLAVVEALAAGLPVLYAACPAIADLPPGAVPGAYRISGDTAELAHHLRELNLSCPAGRPVAEAVGRYDIARTARQLAAVYEDVLDPARPADLPHQSTPADLPSVTPSK
ncbi:glycosyltransferase [Streptomyces sp. NPDC060194]|uniref:glycosyltransferase n=1 Tax=Streptomyces sp. NPDC060194 TaxID=3347069 RepID=UPI0036529664